MILSRWESKICAYYIIEDLPRDRGILKMSLERKEHLVIEAANGLEALELARQEKPELIISDALMPKMDGFELLRECKEDPELREIPFIFYSATYTDQREKQLAAELGAEAFLVKPMEPDAFFAALQKTLTECAGKTSRPSAPLQLEQNSFYERYAKIVAAKLEEKVASLEQEITQRRQAEAVIKKDQLRAARLLEISRKPTEDDREFYTIILDTV